jgi:hypothetical protein
MLFQTIVGKSFLFLTLKWQGQEDHTQAPEVHHQNDHEERDKERVLQSPDRDQEV